MQQRATDGTGPGVQRADPGDRRTHHISFSAGLVAISRAEATSRLFPDGVSGQSVAKPDLQVMMIERERS